MSNRRQRELIIEYWYRALLSISYSLNDIVKIIIEFGKIMDRFDKELVHKSITMNHDGSELSKIKQFKKQTMANSNAFGTFTATPGRIYRWKLKMMKIVDKTSYLDVDIGVIEADEATSLYKRWCCYADGYSYNKNGKIYHYSYAGTSYGQQYTENDIIDVLLDLKAAYDISWQRNGNIFGKGFDVKKEKDYKLAVGIHCGNVKLIAFEIIE